MVHNSVSDSRYYCRVTWQQVLLPTLFGTLRLLPAYDDHLHSRHAPLGRSRLLILFHSSEVASSWRASPLGGYFVRVIWLESFCMVRRILPYDMKRAEVFFMVVWAALDVLHVISGAVAVIVPSQLHSCLFDDMLSNRSGQSFL